METQFEREVREIVEKAKAGIDALERKVRESEQYMRDTGTPRSSLYEFALAMEAVLSSHDIMKGRDGWKECANGWLMAQMYRQFDALGMELRRSKEEFKLEYAMKQAVDVANFAMMIYDNLRTRTEPPDPYCF